jgi:hypothetical protein
MAWVHAASATWTVSPDQDVAAQVEIEIKKLKAIHHIVFELKRLFETAETAETAFSGST